MCLGNVTQPLKNSLHFKLIWFLAVRLLAWIRSEPDCLVVYSTVYHSGRVFHLLVSPCQSTTADLTSCLPPRRATVETLSDIAGIPFIPVLRDQYSSGCCSQWATPSLHLLDTRCGSLMSQSSSMEKQVLSKEGNIIIIINIMKIFSLSSSLEREC